MGDFKRARSAEQKEQRFGEVKRACAELFATRPYHEITLTTIADQLSWSRANLYKYVCTKEEVFLALIEDERESYYAALLEAFPGEGAGASDDAARAARARSTGALNDGSPANAVARDGDEACTYEGAPPINAVDAAPVPDAAATWAGIANAHQLWFRLHDLLFTIIETNVSVERLMEFKRSYYENFPAMSAQLGASLDIRPERIERLMNAVNFHGSGLVTNCCAAPAALEAMERLGVSYQPPDFRADMQEFIAMCLAHAQQRA